MFEPHQWIAVGLDGCLATKVIFKKRIFPEDTPIELVESYEQEYLKLSKSELMPIGNLVPNMAKRVKNWIGSGYKVKIFTGRAEDEDLEEAVREWLHEKMPKEADLLDVTCIIDTDCIEIYGANCVGIQLNTGMLLTESPAGI